MLLLLAVLLAAFVPSSLRAQERGAPALGSLLEGLGSSKRVLMIGAHPDDEDTRLIVWLTRGHHAEVAYLSLTRGDGGQNLIGNELGEALGVIRTEELLAARRIDGAHQYFTRAYDFGFSKSAAEAFSHWPHDSVLRDVVTVVRAFRPHVIVSVFSGTPKDGHGQHQVAGIVAREAFDAAMDTVRFPRSATAGYGAWTPLKFYRTRTYWNGEGATFTYNSGTYDPLLGASYAEIAGESRSQHKSQGFGALQRKGYVAGSVRREGSRVRAPEDPTAERSLFEGIDTTWHRLDSLVRHPGSREAIARLVDAAAEARRVTSLYAPAGGIPALERVRDALAELRANEVDSVRTPDPDVAASIDDGLERATRALLEARGIAIEAEVDRDLLAQGDSIPVTVTVYNRGTTPVHAAVAGTLATEEAPLGSSPARSSTAIAPDSARAFTYMMHGGALTRPWWLATPRRGDLYTVPLDGRMDDVRDAGLRARVLIDGAIEADVPIVHRFADPVRGQVTRPLAVVPPIAVTLDRTVELARASSQIDRTIHVSLRSAVTTARPVTVSLKLPGGLAADSATRTITLPPFGEATLNFVVRGDVPPGRHEVAAQARSGGATYTTGYIPIEYAHIRPQQVYRDARIDLEAVNVKLPPRLAVAYVPGVGDNVAPMLQELGVPLTVIEPEKLATTDLSRFTTVVLGTRAYASHPELVSVNPKLFRWVRRGGRLVVQYGQYEMAQPGLMPYPITLTRPAARVTDENAPVRVVNGSSPVLNTPNEIGASDWRGWVQERSLYMPSTFDPHYHSVLSMNDPGESANEGAILVAPYGKGTYVYTTLSLFRQLPAGNPGASRLFVNLLAPEAGR
ncbi:MAG TPA: PIG-L family deacetylase [Gemmatimonadaceae bacterium]